MSAVLALLIVLSLLTPGPARTIPIDDCLSAGSVASPVASPGACDLTSLIVSIDAELKANAPDRYEIASGESLIESRYLPAGQNDGVTWRVHVSPGGGAHWISLLWYDTETAASEARQAYEDALAAEFFVPATAPDIEAPDACFSLVREESARGICVLSRENLLIVGYSFLEVDHTEAQIGVARDLATMLDQVLESSD